MGGVLLTMIGLGTRRMRCDSSDHTGGTIAAPLTKFCMHTGGLSEGGTTIKGTSLHEATC